MAVAAKRVHLVCNAHLDPVYLWQWEDGLTETLATFNVASEFCDRAQGFVFCHNEAVLYKWVEDNDPALFRRIREHVKAGRWHIAGGAWLQPDLNVPSGESHIRQFLIGKEYFRNKFGVEPTTAYNFDSFGQPEGYAQLLAGCGFDSYIFCRPQARQWKLPVGAFRWRDRSGAEVLARRSDEHYCDINDMHQRLGKWLEYYRQEPVSLILWGIGNHGGGPSWEDFKQIKRFAKEHPEVELIQSTPEAFYREVKRSRAALPRVTGEMQNCHSGCYTSLSRVKRAHRACENLMASTERMAAMAWWLGKAEYPARDLDAAWKDILFGEFHDILPGSCVQPVERDSLALLGGASDALRRTKVRIFLRLLEGEKQAKDGVTPVFVQNPHSFPVTADVECEYNYTDLGMPTCGAVDLDLRDGHTGRKLPFQTEQTEWPLLWDFRTKVSLPLRLAPYEIRRVETTWKKRDTERPWRAPKEWKRCLTLKGRGFRVTINPKSGLVDFAGTAGGKKSFLRRGALRPTVWPDFDHAWECGDPALRKPGERKGINGAPWAKPRGIFRLATPKETMAILSPPSLRMGVGKYPDLGPVRVVEHGPVRTIVEAVFVMGKSAIIRRYVLSRQQPWLEVRERIFWNERDSMLKVETPLGFRARQTISEMPYSAVVRPVPRYHVDQVNQRWVAATEGVGGVAPKGRFVAVLNNAFNAHSISGKNLYLSILRSPVYSSGNLEPKLETHEQRYWPRQDQGEHEVSYRLMVGKEFKEQDISRAAQAFNVPPEWLIHFPRKRTPGAPVLRGAPFISVSPGSVQVVALKKAEAGDGLVVRLCEQAGRGVSATLRVRGVRRPVTTRLTAYGLKTLVLRRKKQGVSVQETNLIER